MYFELIVFLYYILTSVWFSLSARWQMLVLWRPACRSTASLWVSVFTGCRQKCNTINFTDETWRNLCFWKKCWKIIWIKNKVIYGRILYWQIKFIHFCNQWNLYTIYIEHYTCKQSRFINQSRHMQDILVIVAQIFIVSLVRIDAEYAWLDGWIDGCYLKATVNRCHVPICFWFQFPAFPSNTAPVTRYHQ